MTTNDPLVSIIIPHYNERELLRECLSSFEHRDYDPIELVVVDNGSSDGSKEMVRDEFPEVTLVEAPPEAGIGRVNNIGLQRAGGDILAFNFNNDEIMERGWIASLVSVLKNNTEIGIVGGLRLRYNDRSTIDSAGEVYDRLGRRINLKGENHDVLSDTELRMVDYVEVPVMRSELIDAVGFLDETYHFYSEDADFCLRAKHRGYKVAMVPEAITYHRRGTSVKASPQMLYYASRGRLKLFLKNFSGWQLLLAVGWWGLIRPLIYPVSIVRDGSIPASEKIRHALAPFRAVGWTILQLPEVVKQRSGMSSGGDRTG